MVSPTANYLRSSLRRSAFTIAECVAALAITAIVIVLINYLLTGLRKANQRSLDPAVDWYVFLAEMEAPSHQFILKDVKQREMQVKSKQTGLTYELHGNDVLYLSVPYRGGYLPLFNDVRPGHYRFKRVGPNRALMEVERKNGQLLEEIVNFSPE